MSTIPGTVMTKSQDHTRRWLHTSLCKDHRRVFQPRTHSEHMRISSADLGNVCLRSQADHDIQFLQFNIDGVVVLHKEHLDFLLQNFRPRGNITLFHSRLVKPMGYPNHRYLLFRHLPKHFLRKRMVSLCVQRT